LGHVQKTKPQLQILAIQFFYMKYAQPIVIYAKFDMQPDFDDTIWKKQGETKKRPKLRE
jgi:transposase